MFDYEVCFCVDGYVCEGDWVFVVFVKYDFCVWCYGICVWFFGFYVSVDDDDVGLCCGGLYDLLYVVEICDVVEFFVWCEFDYCDCDIFDLCCYDFVLFVYCVDVDVL